MRRQSVFGFLVGVLVGVLLLGGGVFALQSWGSDAQAQSSGTWHIAGGRDGFSIGNWGTGQGSNVSLDEWIESMPVECDILTIARGAMFVSPYYRCPSS